MSHSRSISVARLSVGMPYNARAAYMLYIQPLRLDGAAPRALAIGHRGQLLCVRVTRTHSLDKFRDAAIAEPRTAAA